MSNFGLKSAPLYCGDHIGIVEDLNDPEQLGRVRVRVYGIHSPNLAEVPTESLPWCTIALPANNPFISGLGAAPVGLVTGSMVRLNPLIENDFQEWEVKHTIAGRLAKATSGNGFGDPNGEYPNTDHDVNPLARGKVISSEPYADKEVNATNVDIDGTTNKNETAIDPEQLKNTPWLPVAIGELGIDERNEEKRVREYHAQGGGSSKWGGEVPWCASFIGWVLKQAGIKGSGAASARSYCKWGDDVLNQSKIPAGAIGVIAGNRGANSGHVFFITDDDGTWVKTVGGNQSSKSEDNGGEVTRSKIKKSRLIAARFPNASNALRK